MQSQSLIQPSTILLSKLQFFLTRTYVITNELIIFLSFTRLFSFSALAIRILTFKIFRLFIKFILQGKVIPVLFESLRSVHCGELTNSFKICILCHNRWVWCPNTPHSKLFIRFVVKRLQTWTLLRIKPWIQRLATF